MKDLKSLKPTEICIRATKENAEFIIPLLEKLGGVNPYNYNSQNIEIGEYWGISSFSNQITYSVDKDEVEHLTELTLSELQEYVKVFLAGVKEPQTGKIGIATSDEVIAALRQENESLKDLLKRFSFACQITGGTAGRDEMLVSLIEESKTLLK